MPNTNIDMEPMYIFVDDKRIKVALMGEVKLRPFMASIYSVGRCIGDHNFAIECQQAVTARFANINKRRTYATFDFIYKTILEKSLKEGYKYQYKYTYKIKQLFTAIRETIGNNLYNGNNIPED